MTSCASKKELEGPLAPLDFNNTISTPASWLQTDVWKKVNDCFHQPLSPQEGIKFSSIYKNYVFWKFNLHPKALKIPSINCIDIIDGRPNPDLQIFIHLHHSVLRNLKRPYKKSGWIVDDIDIFKQIDFWATTRDIFTLGRWMGDCEDYSLAYYELLVSLWVSPNQIFLWIGKYNQWWKVISHAVLLLTREPIHEWMDISKLSEKSREVFVFNDDTMITKWFYGYALWLNPRWSWAHLDSSYLEFDETWKIRSIKSVRSWWEYADYFRRLRSYQ
jgi:hypothetical protein